ncbi:MAG: tetratricopeptide repeat protein [Lachnospiraceae bacterium]|nr:tetratricopeptide repeat protein [Lachnospiraceae bacterium]
MSDERMNGELKKEDYAEPQCLLNMHAALPEAPARPVPMSRIIEKLDEHLSRDDWAAAERHLDYWLADALAGGDKKGALAIQGERMGLLRKRGREAEAMAAVNAALTLLEETGMEGSLTGATAWVNIATVYKTFGRSAEALPYYEKAQAVYEAHLRAPDSRLGGLYNNMALALMDLGRYPEARSYYGRALSVMENIPGGELEMAVTYLNLADLVTLENGPEEAEEAVQDLLDQARTALDTPSLPRNGYYAFVLRSCAPTFRYYGRFMDAEELEETAREIYGRKE